MRLHYFNPENDLALAANVANYTAPKAARWLHDAGAALPLWYGDDCDRVLCYGVNDAWLSKMQDAFAIKADVFNHNGTDASLLPCPWGWSLAARADFIDQEVPEDLLPQISQIDKMRQLSHRRTALEVNRRLRDALDFPIAGEGIEAFSLQDASEAIKAYGNAYVKAPWSSSGRGVASSQQLGTERALKFADDSIRRQGSVIVERAYDKRADFALLYRCEGSRCDYLGTSVFTVDNGGAYKGNVLATEDRRRAILSQHLDLGRLDAISVTLRSIIGEMIAPHYDGVLGIDMLATKEGKIDPTVEVNLRTTMGYVAMRLAGRVLAPGAEGVFTVRQGNLADVTEWNALTIESHRLAKGTLFLTPASAHFAFEVKVNVGLSIL